MQVLIINNFGLIMIVISVILSVALCRVSLCEGCVKNFLINILVIYAFIMIVVWGFDSYLTWKLNSFDVDGNGIFSASESTDEQYLYQNLVMNDLGRNLSIIWGLVVAPIISLFGIFFNWVFNKLFNITTVP